MRGALRGIRTRVERLAEEVERAHRDAARVDIAAILRERHAMPRGDRREVTPEEARANRRRLLAVLGRGPGGGVSAAA